jgi:hypothetical protein
VFGVMGVVGAWGLEVAACVCALTGHGCVRAAGREQGELMFQCSGV